MQFVPLDRVLRFGRKAIESHDFGHQDPRRRTYDQGHNVEPSTRKLHQIRRRGVCHDPRLRSLESSHLVKNDVSSRTHHPEKDLIN